MPEKGHVSLQQIQPALFGILAGAGGDDAQIGVGGVGVVEGGVDLGPGEEGGGVLEVEHLAPELVFIGVDEGELVGEVLGEDGLGDGHADVSDADDGDLGGAFGGGQRGSAGDGGEEGFGEVKAAGAQVGRG